MPELYDRQNNINLNTDISIGIIGAGGVGFWVGMLAAMSGVKKITVWDPDKIEIHNLNRIPLPLHTVGMTKVEALRDSIISLRPDAEVIPIVGEITPEGLIDYIQQVEHINVIIDCSDSYQSQIKIYKQCHELGLWYQRAGYDGAYSLTTATLVPEWGLEIDPLNDGHYRVVPSWAIPAITVAALAVTAVVGQLRSCQNLSLNLQHIKST